MILSKCQFLQNCDSNIRLFLLLPLQLSILKFFASFLVSVLFFFFGISSFLLFWYQFFSTFLDYFIFIDGDSCRYFSLSEFTLIFDFTFTKTTRKRKQCDKERQLLQSQSWKSNNFMESNRKILSIAIAGKKEHLIKHQNLLRFWGHQHYFRRLYVLWNVKHYFFDQPPSVQIMVLYRLLNNCKMH